jgi:hypothetical protein
MTISREVKEGVQPQGIGEQIAYKLSSTPWASTPTVTGVKAYDVTEPDVRIDVTSTVLSGSSGVVGDQITTPIVKSLTVDRVYWIEITFTSGGLTFVPYFIVRGEY